VVYGYIPGKLKWLHPSKKQPSSFAVVCSSRSPA